jgi:hypothetical protein
MDKGSFQSCPWRYGRVIEQRSRSKISLQAFNRKISVCDKRLYEEVKIKTLRFAPQRPDISHHFAFDDFLNLKFDHQTFHPSIRYVAFV